MPNTATARRVRVAREPRDQIGHWVIPSGEQKPCHHHCCEGKRVHPANLPVKLNRAYLRSLSQDDLEREVEQYGRFSDSHETGFLQLLAEDQRRMTSAERAAARAERHRSRQAARREEHRDEVHRQWLAAENATNGYMLNKAGLAANIDERSLFTGPASRVNRYASPELREWFAAHGRPTAASYHAGRQRQDIRY